MSSVGTESGPPGHGGLGLCRGSLRTGLPRAGQRTPGTLASETQARLCHLQGLFSKGESHFRGAERSIVNFFFLKLVYFSAPSAYSGQFTNDWAASCVLWCKPSLQGVFVALY